MTVVAFLGGYGVLMWLAQRVSRDQFLRFMVVLSGILAVVSFFLALHFRVAPRETRESWGYALIGFWVIAPPLYFLIEYALWPPPRERERAVEHLHDLGRGIWVAVVVLLALTMGVGPDLFAAAR
jgi:hypothetical protein